MSYQEVRQCSKCANTAPIEINQLPCKRILCDTCKEQWLCSCSICEDNKKDVFVLAHGTCNVCKRSTKTWKDNLCDTCDELKRKIDDRINSKEQNIESGVWSYIESLGSIFCFTPKEEEPKSEKSVVTEKVGLNKPFSRYFSRVDAPIDTNRVKRKKINVKDSIEVLVKERNHPLVPRANDLKLP
jgi:hypothetical protein